MVVAGGRSEVVRSASGAVLSVASAVPMPSETGSSDAAASMTASVNRPGARACEKPGASSSTLAGR